MSRAAIVRGPETVVTMDTAMGLVQAVAKVNEGKVLSVNVPAFVVELDFPRVVPVDVVFGGQFFARRNRSTSVLSCTRTTARTWPVP